MKQEYSIYCPQFFTATIYEREHLLADDRHKNIIIESLQFLAPIAIGVSNHIYII
jgi:hypothetical protein